MLNPQLVVNINNIIIYRILLRIDIKNILNVGMLLTFK